MRLLSKSMPNTLLDTLLDTLPPQMVHAPSVRMQTPNPHKHETNICGIIRCLPSMQPPPRTPYTRWQGKANPVGQEVGVGNTLGVPLLTGEEQWESVPPDPPLWLAPMSIIPPHSRKHPGPIQLFGQSLEAQSMLHTFFAQVQPRKKCQKKRNASDSVQI